jgi:hypothetical protein
MARYETPPDPRQSDLRPRRPRRLRGDRFDWAPILGFTLGVIVTVIAIILAWQLARTFLEPPPLALQAPAPTIVRLTAQATLPPSPTPPPPTPTPIPSLTPLPTPDLRTPPPTVTIGYYAVVANTGGLGVIVRNGPSTDSTRLRTAGDGVVGLVLAGPQTANGFTWWQLRLTDDNVEGWVVADFLTPTGQP